jgi:RNA polymerase sigma-70 factor (ECF subfamily)
MTHKPQPPQVALANRFERIYLSTYFRLEKFVQHFIRNPEAAKDMLQDTYVQLWEHLEQIRDDEKILPLLRTYATHRMINMLRKSAKDQQHAELFYARQEVITTADETLNLKESLQEYETVLNRLTDQQRTVFRLSTEEGMSYKQIAEELNSTPRTIKYHLSEARKRLRLQFSTDKLAIVLLLVEMQRQ